MEEKTSIISQINSDLIRTRTEAAITKHQNNACHFVSCNERGELDYIRMQSCMGQKATLSELSIGILPNNKKFMQILGVEELEAALNKSIAVNEELAKKEEALKKELEEKKYLCSSIDRANELLRNKLQQADRVNVADYSNRRLLLKKLNDRKKEFDTIGQTVIQKMALLLRKHFAKPPDINCISLEEMIEELMNLYFEKPNDYIELSEKYWPPYVELLHRYGIIVSQTNDDRLIKLNSLFFV